VIPPSPENMSASYFAKRWREREKRSGIEIDIKVDIGKT